MGNSAYGYTDFVSSGGVSAKLPQIITDMVAQGKTDLRLQIPWYLIDTAGNGVSTGYTWTGLDDAVSRCNAAGINIIFSIMYAPAGGPNPSTLFPITSPVGFYTYAVSAAACGSGFQYLPDPQKMATFAIQVVQRYNGGAKGFLYAMEPGNEEGDLGGNANCVRDQGGVWTASVLTKCYSQIKAALPSCLVIAPALLRQDETHIQQWLTDLYNGGGFKACDALSFHFYKNGGTSTFPVGIPPDNAPTNFGFTQFWRKMYQVMIALGWIKPIWCTEYGYDAVSVATNGSSNTDAYHQWYYGQYMLLNAMKSGIIKKMYYYTIGNNDPKSQTQHGQVDGLTETYNPIFYTDQAFVAQHPQSDWEPMKSTTKQLSLTGAATNVLVTGAATTLLLTEK